jgi:catechol 2,3-dioxygenase-like lactoylglutathione lyase family enzyme
MTTQMSRRIAYVTLVVKDYDEAKAWYRDVLGFVEVEDTPLQDNKRWVVVAPSESAGTGLLLAKASSDLQQERIGDQTGGRVFLFLHTDDFWRDYRSMLLARPAARLASSLDFLQGTFEKIHLQGLFRQDPLQMIHLFAQSGGARTLSGRSSHPRYLWI